MFSFSSWLHNLRTNVSRNARRRAAKRRPAPRLDVECLEDRVVPTAFHPTYVVYHPPVGPYQSSTPPSGSYGPNDIRTAYGINNIVFPGGVVGDGTGQTIAVVDAYDDPAFVSSVNADGSSNAAAFANSDLANFDSYYGIPNPPEFLKVNQAGVNGWYPGVDPAGPPDDWEGEEALDVEWAHAIAPKANIILVEADNANTLFAAVQTAAALPGVTVVSMSFGGGEYPGETANDSIFQVNGVTFLASAGDSGSPGGYPAYSPNVVAVGGTSLNLNPTSTWKSETAWSFQSYYGYSYGGATGGGQSHIEPEPAYQEEVQNSGSREMPDVAFVADPSTGVATYDSYDNGASTPWDTVGGTSLSSPCWAGLIAITNQGRSLADLGSLTGYSQTLPAIYNLYASSPGDFHDIVSGNNDPSGGNHYNAGPGYDMTTGLGTPIANQLVPDLAELTDVAPVVTTSAGSAEFTIGESAIAIDPGISVTADGGNFVGATVAITGGHVGADDVLAFTDQNGITGTFSNTTGVLTLSGSAAAADYQAALASVTYADANPLAKSGTRAITFTVNDGLLTGSNTRTISVTVPNPVVSPDALPAAKVGAAYSQAITALNGVAPFKFTISAGALPAGLTLGTNTGIIGGTPTGGGNADFTVKATDSSPSAAGGPYSGTRAYLLTVAPPTLAIGPATLPAAQVAVNYSQTITVTGGTAPYILSVGNTLPAGMSFDPTTGLLSGTPTAGGPLSVTVQVTDSSTGTGPYLASKTYTLAVSPPTITFNPSSLPADKIGVPYSVTISASGGTLPLSHITIVGGTLPAGLSFDGTTGILSGTPTAAGTFNFDASITDSSTGTGPYPTTEVYALVIAAPTLTFSPSSLPSTQTGAAYNATIALSGGSAPYTYAITTGTLPVGLTLNGTTGVISGVPTTGGTVTFTVTATDSSTGTGAPFPATKTYSIAVNAPTIAFSPATLPNAQVAVSYSQVLAVNGGVAPYTLTVTAGALPAGLTFNGRTSTIGGTPKAGGFFSFTITATDSSKGTGPFSKAQSYSLNVAAPAIAINPPSLPGTVVGAAYEQSVVATGGTAPYTYAVTTGALPTGLTLNAATGEIDGEPTAGDSFSFTIKATDSSSSSTGPYFAVQGYTLVVAPPTITFMPLTLANTTVGAAYNVTFVPTGGTAPYTNIQITSGTLPAGLTLSPGGVLSGTPTARGTFTFTVAATDSSTGSGPYPGSQTYTLIVAPPMLVFTPATLVNVQVGVPYVETIAVSGGIAPYSNIELGTGSLPAGLSLSSAGLLIGTPTAGGTFNFSIVATDSSTGTGPFNAGQNFSLIVKAPVFVFSPPSLPAGQVGAAYEQPVTVSGGIAPYSSFAVTAGVLPVGLSLDPSSGIISGTPTEGGPFPITISATDSSTGASPYTESVSYTLNIAPPTVSLSPATLIGGEISVPYSQTLAAGGGTGPYTYAVSAGTLPAGLSLSPAGVLSGTPTKTGTLGVAIKATDSSTGSGPYSVTQTYTIAVYAPLSITTTTLPTYWAVNTPGYNQAIATAGGAGAVNFAVIAGSLPIGLSLDPATGVLGGTPVDTPDGVGNFNFVIKATDSVGATATRQYTVTINPPNFVYTPTSMTLTISGTNFQFTQATTADAAGTHTAYTFTMDSFSETLPDTVLSNVVVTGASAGATATLITNDTYIGTDKKTHETSEIVVLGGGGGQLMKTNAAGNFYPFLQLKNFSSTYAYLGHADSGRLNATAGASNIFVTAGGYSYMVAPASFSLISGGANVYGYAAGPTDQAWQYDGGGPSTFVVSGTAYSTMSGTANGQAFYNEAVGFTVNYGIATHPGQDVAYFLDSPLNDTFVGNVGVSYMYADNANGTLAEFDEAENFATIYADAFVGGTNTAYNYDPSQNIIAGWVLAPVS